MSEQKLDELCDVLEVDNPEVLVREEYYETYSEYCLSSFIENNMGAVPDSGELEYLSEKIDKLQNVVKNLLLFLHSVNHISLKQLVPILGCGYTVADIKTNKKEKEKTND